jgi:xylan 1,4-beta-xylosidase
VKPGRLNLCYQVFARPPAEGGTKIDIRALNAGVTYYVAVEAFDENGVSPLSKNVTVL